MNVFTSKKFDKMFKKCPQEIKGKFIEKLKVLKENRHNPIMFLGIAEQYLKKN